MIQPNHRLFLGLVPALLAGVAPRIGAAQEGRDLGLSVSAGVEYSDNIGRTSVDAQHETVIDAGLAMNVSRDRGALRLALATDLRYRKFLNGRFGNELLGGASARLAYEVIPDRLIWILEDEYGQSFIDPRAVETPQNRQGVNFVTTGPDIRIPIGGITSLAIEGRASQAWYEESSLGSTQYRAALGVVRQLGARNAVSAFASEDRFEYDDLPSGDDFKIRSAYLMFDGRGAKTNLRVMAGNSGLVGPDNDTSGLLLDVALTREFTARSSLSFNAGTDLTEASGAFRRGRSGLDLAVTDDTFRLVSADPLRSTFAILSWSYAGPSRSLDIAMQWRKEEHERRIELDRERLGAEATFTRRLQPSLSMSLYTSYFQDDFSSLQSGFDEWSVGLATDWRVVRAYSLRLRFDRIDGSIDASSAAPVLGKFVENRASFRVTYTPGT